MNVVSPRESLSVMIPALPPGPGPGHTRKSAKPTSPLRAHRWFPQSLQMAVRRTSKLGSGGDQPDAGTLPNPGSILQEDARNAADGPELSSPVCSGLGGVPRARPVPANLRDVESGTTGTTGPVVGRTANVEACRMPKSPLQCHPVSRRLHSARPDQEAQCSRPSAKPPFPQGRGAAQTDRLSKSEVLTFLSLKAKSLGPFADQAVPARRGHPHP